MHVVNDFFLLVWNERLSQQVVFDEKQVDTLTHLLSRSFDDFCDTLSIILMMTPQNLSSVASLELAQSLFTNTFERLPNKETCMNAQMHSLQCLINLGNLRINEAIMKRLEHLRKEGIISYDALRTLNSLLSLIEEKKIETTTLHVKSATSNENYYKNALSILQTAIENLKLVVETDIFEKKLDQTKERLQNQRFSIGITGVMNAGKSTMLNALLGQEVLGTSVVPETANLTLIKYAKEPYAVVNFWNQKEWRKIEEGAQSLKSLEAFIQESKTHFGETLDTYLTKEGRSETIAVDTLAQYTSAKHSDKKCNLVKSVELFTDLKFVQDGVQIVDTPGLDDPVVQREEITLEYLSECDLMIHLMNAAQAATQKDVDFIIDALLYRNVAQLLVVITRIDAIKEKELEEVINYTKRSIEARLKEQNKGSKLDEVIAKIVFIPIAGKLALLHKLGRESEALSLGYDLEKTGLPLVERYLEEVLFGEKSEKAALIISANKKELESIIDASSQAFMQEKHLLSISQEEIAQAYAKHRHEKEQAVVFLEQIHQALLQSQDEMKLYFGTLYKFAHQKLDTLQAVLKRRIIDDVSYEFSKNKKAPKEDRIASIVETAMKDGMVDLIRDYRYEFEKKMQSMLEYMDAKYGEFQQSEARIALDAKAFCEEHLGALLVFKNNTILAQNMNEAIKKYGKNDLSQLAMQCDDFLGREFNTIKEMLEEKLQRVNNALLESFVHVCETPAQNLEARFAHEEALLENAMKRIQDQSFARETRLSEIGEKERVLKIVQDDLAGIKGRE